MEKEGDFIRCDWAEPEVRVFLFLLQLYVAGYHILRCHFSYESLPLKSSEYAFFPSLYLINRPGFRHEQLLVFVHGILIGSYRQCSRIPSCNVLSSPHLDQIPVLAGTSARMLLVVGVEGKSASSLPSLPFFRLRVAVDVREHQLPQHEHALGNLRRLAHILRSRGSAPQYRESAYWSRSRHVSPRITRIVIGMSSLA